MTDTEFQESRELARAVVEEGQSCNEEVVGQHLHKALDEIERLQRNHDLAVEAFHNAERGEAEARAELARVHTAIDAALDKMYEVEGLDARDACALLEAVQR
jgi:ribosome-associated translation inhibitor RaiA